MTPPFALIDHRLRVGIHKDVVRDPEAHAWALNLFLSGEEYPTTVTDYFQKAFFDFDSEIAGRFKAHESDERRHCKMFRGALDLIGMPRKHEAGDVYNDEVKAHLPRPLGLAPNSSRDDVRQQLGHFLLHLHYLETRVGRALGHHLEACHALSSPVAPIIERVVADESRHAVYTLESAREMLSRDEFADLSRLNRVAEARANRAFSLKQARRFESDSVSKLGPAKRILYRFVLGMMEASARA